MNLKSKFFEVVHEDSDLLILNKSAGISVIPERNNTQKSVTDWLQVKFEFIKPVHRIDKDTSGLLIFAKSLDVYKAMNKLFLERQIVKEYIAITKGKPYKDELIIDLPLKQANNSIHMKVSQAGKESRSFVRLLESTNHYSLLNIKIETGRTHQIRVHLSHKGMPIVGDELYNTEPHVFLSKIKKKYSPSKDAIERPLMSRTALHASKLEFRHPMSHEIISLELSLPKDMRVCWKQFNKYDVK